MEETEYDIFISYSRKDKIFASKIAQILKKENFTVWWDISIPTGQVFDMVIENAIKSSRVVLVIWSVNSIESDWVRLEAREGKSRGILVPILIDNSEIPFAFKDIQTAQLINWNFSKNNLVLNKVIEDIKLILDKKNNIHKIKSLTEKGENKSSTKVIFKTFIIVIIGTLLTYYFISLYNKSTSFQPEAIVSDKNDTINESVKTLTSEVDLIEFNEIDRAPVFPGCEYIDSNIELKVCTDDEISKLIQEKINAYIIRWPGIIRGIENRFKISFNFKVNSSGKVFDIGASAPNWTLREETIRLLNSLPKMEPGEHKGKKVNVIFSKQLWFQIK